MTRSTVYLPKARNNVTKKKLGGCRGKIKHATAKEARAAIRSLRRSTHVVDADRLEAYLCPCGFFHVGHER